ncbi:TIGR00730 family Rossman fold protein [Aneurinibacillus thermoaerophilus]|uniref:LOG family protein n=1 Tax=Aneurinibacillus thermoaerophilus TaxID=143495 RepID=UPI002E20FE55|nr:TIGR00730 family Rossman fold protein [Aneurinibacillus thermoaerophilus]
MKRVCVFAGSNPGTHPEYKESAIQLGKELVKKGIELVYGGSNIGLMGTIANTVLEQGGTAIGVMPTNLFREEVVHQNLTHLYEVKDMHERKAKMGELSDAFIALPGGYGTFEEIFEFVSWGQLGIHNKPVAVLNVEGYYNPLMEMIAKAVEGGFMPSTHKEFIICESDPIILLEKIRTYKPPVKTNKWSELEYNKNK